MPAVHNQSSAFPDKVLEEREICAGKMKLASATRAAIFSLSLLALGCSDDRGKLPDPLAQLDQSPVSELQPDGELAEILAIGSTYTDVQRENLLLQIRGKTVDWSLPVHEVSRHGFGYRVQTISEQLAIFDKRNLLVGAVIYITPRTNPERLEIEALRTGDIISFKGNIKDTTLRNVEIDPARLVSNPYISAGAAQRSAAVRDDSLSILAQEEDEELRIAFAVSKDKSKGQLTIYHVAKEPKPDYLRILFEQDIKAFTIGKTSSTKVPTLRIDVGGATLQQHSVEFFREKVDGKDYFGVLIQLDGTAAVRKSWCGLAQSERKPLEIKLTGKSRWAGFIARRPLRMPTTPIFEC